MVEVVWITSEFPFGTGEHFIHGELDSWAGQDIVLLPEKRADSDVNRAQGFPVDTTLADRWVSRPWLARALARALSGRVFWREALWLVRQRRASPTRLRIALRTTAQVYLIADTLRGIARSQGRPIQLVYGYWLSAGVLAGAMGRRRGFVEHVVCRAHGTDLWEHSRTAQYTPLVRQFAADIDAVFAISAKGSEHLRHYGFTVAQSRVARLGVSLRDDRTPPTPAGELHVLTLSSLTPLKRLDKVIDAMGLLPGLLPGMRLRWTHIGDGPLRDELSDRAGRVLGPTPVEYALLGQLDHAEALAWLAGNAVDVILNTSDSEGIPVSLMEAMSLGIPAIGPDVGAVGELVPPELLLPEGPDPARVAAMLAANVEVVKDPAVRDCARAIVVDGYDAARNHAAFVAEVTALAGGSAA